ncbi:malonate decarboxylase acyl carrier protein [Gordonia sp. NPDC003424]
MQSLTLTFPAHAELERPVHVGVVASGDLEILMTPRLGGEDARVELRTSVDGFDDLWRRVLERTLREHAFAARYEINDFGATPGMVTLRLAQAAQIARNGDTGE